MSRPPNVIRSVKLNTALPENIMARLELHLYSELEGRVPTGAYAKFIGERITEFFSERLDDAELHSLAAVRAQEEFEETPDQNDRSAFYLGFIKGYRHAKP